MRTRTKIAVAGIVLSLGGLAFAADLPTWMPGVFYPGGARVFHGTPLPAGGSSGAEYECRQGHTAQTGWEPPVTPAL